MIWLIFALVVAGLVLLFLEILTPSFGILLGLGVIAFGAAGWLTWRESPTAGMILTVVVLVVVPFYLVGLVKVLPKTALGRRLFLGESKHDQGEGTPDAVEDAALMGKTGTAETTLRPSGAVRVDGRRVQATAEGGMIEKGAAVKVVRPSGANIVVRRAGEA